jgi:RHS repeat-associated protein
MIIVLHKNARTTLVIRAELVQYTYDATSRRIQRQHLTPTNTQTTTCFYDSWNVIHERTTNATPTETTPATLITTHHWGLDLSNTLQGAGGVGGLLHSKTTNNSALPNNATSAKHYLYDANGNITDLLTPTGTLTAHYEYDPFGNTLNATAQENPYRFSTKPYDPITHLHYYGYRFYFPQLGRWLSRDPYEYFVEEDDFENIVNLYLKCQNDLVLKIDILGLVPTGSTFEREYPKYPPSGIDGPTFWKKVGGKVQETFGGQDSCATRVSYTLNKIGGGEELPFTGILAPPDIRADGRNYPKEPGTTGAYLVNARKMGRYLEHKWGKSEQCSKSDAIYIKSKAKTVDELRTEIEEKLKKCCRKGYVAVVFFEFPKGKKNSGHVGMITPTYNDPSTPLSGYELGEIWILPPDEVAKKDPSRGR